MIHAIIINYKKRTLLRAVHNLADAKINLVLFKIVTGFADVTDFIQCSFFFVFHSSLLSVILYKIFN